MSLNRRTLLLSMASLAVAPACTTRGAAKAGGNFPSDFLWGAATAGHQIEGNNYNSCVWVMENIKPTVYAEPSGDADNSLALWPQDLDLVKALGLNTYRFSLEWSRIQPEHNLFSIAMLDHYKAIIDGCRTRGLQPMVTFNHYTTPRWFAARGGWTNNDAPKLFADFCDRAARHLGDGMSYATTLNEPNLINLMRASFSKEQTTQFLAMARAMSESAARAVGSKQFVAGNSISVEDIDAYTQNMIAAHKAGRAAIKAARSSLPVGVSLAIPDDVALGDNSVRDAMRAKMYGAWLEAAKADDFLGVQNYDRTFWDAKGKVEQKDQGDRNAAGGTVYPGSLAGAVRYAHSVTRLPIIVTEHGVNSEDDAVRARLIPAALAELKKAMDEGVPVKGYLHWSLLDNFEWISGYKPKYGLVAVDRTTFTRTMKPSAKVLGAIARSNAIAMN
jgi:beta-glucosidase